jgi:hypothetical protein
MPDYKVVDGTYYHQDTPDEVVEILEQIRKSGARVRLFYGDKWTGRDFLEENDVVGYIHRSAGPIKTPILIPRSDSICGSPIMDNAVVRITRGKVNLYQQDNYQNLVSYSVSNDQVDPLWTVMREGGPYHTRGQLRGYNKYLKATDRTHLAEELVARHRNEL